MPGGSLSVIGCEENDKDIFTTGFVTGFFLIVKKGDKVFIVCKEAWSQISFTVHVHNFTRTLDDLPKQHSAVPQYQENACSMLKWLPSRENVGRLNFNTIT